MPGSEIGKQLTKKLLIIALPFVLYGIAVALIDPFNYFGDNGLIGSSVKERYAARINSPLYLLVNFRNRHTGNFLLGDSRMEQMDTSLIRKISGRKFSNLSFGASTLGEMISTFWQAVEWQKPSAVYFGLSLEHYNQMNNRNRLPGVIGMMHNPLLYFSNYNVMESSFLVVRATLTGDPVRVDVPEMNRDEFWDYQVNTTARRYLSNWVYPSGYYQELKKISDYCREHGMRLVFVIFPTHIDLQNLFDHYSLRVAEQRFISDLSGLGEVYNFNIPSEITLDKQNFKDPFHTVEAINQRLAMIIFGDDTTDTISSKPLFKYTGTAEGRRVI